MSNRAFLSRGESYSQVWFFCPGCKGHHAVVVDRISGNGPLWHWNNSVELPTFSPSVMVNRGSHDQCHSFVKEGKIQFLGDCFHELKNQTVDLPDWEGFGQS